MIVTGRFEMIVKNWSKCKSSFINDCLNEPQTHILESNTVVKKILEDIYENSLSVFQTFYMLLYARHWPKNEYY